MTRREPCPICGKPDYCCRSGDLVLCMRVESQKPSTNRMGGWLHVVDGAPPVVVSLPKKDKPIIDWGALAHSMFTAPTAAEERHYLARTLGVSEAALIDLEVGRGWDEWRGKPYSSWPERDATGKVVGIVRRYRDGAKKTMRHSSHGLYFVAHWAVMPGPVFLPEGGSDTAALISVGVNAIGRPSNLGGVKELAKVLSGVDKGLIVIGEDDRKQIDECKCGRCLRCWPGLAGAVQTAERLGKALKRLVRVRLFPGEKDSRAWLAKHPSANAADVLEVLDYDPVHEPCRVCGRKPPHETRGRQVLCLDCRALLENLP